MRSSFRALRRLAFVVPLLALGVQPIAAQSSAAKSKPAAAAPAKPAATGPWLYRGSDVPQDKEWVFGELPNGVRYAVRKNGVPPGQVAIRVRMDVGSLHEEESERGFAHLLEHLVFRQSRYLAEGAAIPTWQRLGATFGSDTNAETSPVSTTFKLDLPNATPAKLDESLKLLSGMMIAPALTEANIRTEVPIVLAEKRERGGLAERVADATTQTLFAGQRMAMRPVIGTTETLQAANHASVRAFHSRWYRPDNAVIIVVGDIETAQIEAMVRQHFADWPAIGKRTPAPTFGDPIAPKGSNPANPIGQTRVVVEPDLPRGLTYAVMRPWRPVQDTIAYNQGIMLDSLAQAIINRRLEARARAGGSFLFAQVNQEKVSQSADATFVSVTPLDENWTRSLKEVRGVIADALATPPSDDEIEREVAEFNVAFESSVEQRRLLAGAKLADDMVTALDIRETIASPETVLEIFNSSRNLFTPQAVLEHTRRLFKGVVTRAVYVTPKADEAQAASLAAALAAPAVADPKARPGGKPISFAEMPAIGAPGKLVSSGSAGILGIEQLEFANGVKVLLWPTTDEPGRVSVKVRFGAGFRAFSAGDAAYIALGDMALVGSGQGQLGQEELDRISTGRKMGYDFAIQDASFQFSADTRSSDMADQLFLFAQKFAQPRWDSGPVLRAKAAARLRYESFSASPQGVLERDLEFLLRGRDPRFRTPTPQEVEAATPEGFRQVWQPILEQGPIEVQLFGDFTRDQAVAALERSFGALAPRPAYAAPLQPARVPTLPPSGVPVTLDHRGDPTQAAALISWPTGGGMASITESRQLVILSDLFQNRLMDAMREKLGAAYAPQVQNSWPQDLENGGSLTAMAQLSPKAVPEFFKAAEQIAADLVAQPPSADELERVIEPLRQQISRASTSSSFFMYQLEGATSEPAKFAGLRTLLSDYTRATPEQMQALARKYLQPGRSWRAQIMPQGAAVASAAARPSKPLAPAPAEGR
ncbi:M16 family metallopeptidase [Novosphingobium ginsenosidimutans]|uniref:Insulinase family protein n=1 Tax=Novosphingobium ginsenosidimutans TaxID=1176536 RepID=A0A5B8RZF9_9SPHN|nr:M16 family metallopeptidase [Novosphingobium ginsenosidimutans]QEA14839.1 insulinase family protein [Novosphingobium ginsenosidimutans]